ncbi:MAG: aminotransferase class III-fold pyridoxal phosphate-dependent enzyme [Roseiflexaceae bacterium]
MSILAAYQQLHPRSAELAGQARLHFPSGVTHDARFQAPFPLFVARSAGARKWDADEQELIDYVTGHGALILGHGHPEVVAAVQAQMVRGTHLGAEHELALRWAELIQGLFPSVERVRFTASGTEATMLAVRLAHAYTGKSAVIRFAGHYHGWHDLLARDSEADHPAGVLESVREASIVLPTDLNLVAAALSSRDDIAAVVLEPTGASYGMVPLPAGFLVALRELTASRGVLLICDEVVTGFRVAPGGEQQRSGVMADLTTFAKILAGGLPGGAVGGRLDVMRPLDFASGAQKIRHNGTFNANPLSAVAGVATLERIRTGEPNRHALAIAEQLIAGLNRLFRSRKLDGWAAYGNGSVFHLVVGVQPAFPAGELPADLSGTELKRGGDAQLLGLLRMALINHGVDLMRGRSGFTSIAHTQSDVLTTIAAFERALDDIAEEVA